MIEIQQQYEGFLKTPLMWNNNNTINLKQIEFQKCNISKFNQKLPSKPLRLGKLVERFVIEELKQHKDITILANNIQIQDDKITIGELDCILLKNNVPVHLEIIYKFYLYDSATGTNELEHWIGPNKRDSFIKKLVKLQEKQLPLLYNKKTKPYLNDLHLSFTNILQKVYFKAQLFVPLKDYGKTFPIINNNSIYGFYIKKNELSIFDDCKFYVPSKKNWLIDTHTNVDWCNFNTFLTIISDFLLNKNAPLCWLKKENGELFKFFVVWW